MESDQSHVEPEKQESVPEKKASVFKHLFKGKKLIQAVRERKVHITGVFVLLLALFLSLLTVLPIFLVLFVKLLQGEVSYGFFGSLRRSFYFSVSFLFLIPLFKWWGQSKAIYFCLQIRRKRELPSFSFVLLARSFGLLPILIFLPLKVLLFPPEQVLHHIFFPPMASLVLTSAHKFLGFQVSEVVEFFLLTNASTYIRSSFYISLALLGMTFFLTIRKLHQLTEIPKLYLAGRVFLAIMLWEFCCVGMLVAYQAI